MTKNNDTKPLNAYVTAEEAVDIAGLKRSTFSAYVARGSAPEHVAVMGNRRLYDRAEIENWAANRPGQGARTDLRR